MKDSNIYRDMALRTSGDIYIGVVGPVRTGKSTFIKKFMETLVLPNIENEYRRERAQDELPQSAAGKTIMTTEPKFVPEEAEKVRLDGETEFSVRLIDCVGYIVPSAIGYIEENAPRMVKTPWFEDEVPFNLAAEVVDQLFQFTRIMRYGGTILIVLMGVGTLFIIVNTIRLTVYARRREINIMKYVGATDWFICWPFILEGVFIGLVGSCISAVVLQLCYSASVVKLQAALAFLPILSTWPLMFFIWGILVALGAIIGALGSFISLRKFLEV